MSLTISEKLQYITTRILVKKADGNTSVGTGYFFGFCSNDEGAIVSLVTNRHVFEDGDECTLVMSSQNADGSPNDKFHIKPVIKSLQNKIYYHPDDEIDLAILPLGHIFKSIESKNEEILDKIGIPKGLSPRKIFYQYLTINNIPEKEKYKEFSTIEDIIMVGYPNGLWDETNNFPLIRKGITASPLSKNYNGKEEFVIDAACYNGSSGSPILMLNNGSYTDNKGNTIIGSRFYFLGTLYAGPQHTARGKIEILPIPTDFSATPVVTIPNNLGYVINAEKLIDFEKILEEKI